MIDTEYNENSEPELICKLTDFGFSCVLDQGESLHQRLGTPLYMAPEMVENQAYDSKVDTWALGVLAYVLLSGGRYPFADKELSIILRKVCNEAPNFAFVSEYDDPLLISDFLNCCLQKDPNLRYSSEQLL